MNNEFWLAQKDMKKWQSPEDIYETEEDEREVIRKKIEELLDEIEEQEKNDLSGKASSVLNYRLWSLQSDLERLEK